MRRPRPTQWEVVQSLKEEGLRRGRVGYRETAINGSSVQMRKKRIASDEKNENGTSVTPLVVVVFHVAFLTLFLPMVDVFIDFTRNCGNVKDMCTKRETY